MLKTFLAWTLLGAMLLFVAPQEVWHAHLDAHALHEKDGADEGEATDAHCLMCDLGTPLCETQGAVLIGLELPVRQLYWNAAVMDKVHQEVRLSSDRGPPLA